MLETKINALTQAIILLTNRIDSLSPTHAGATDNPAGIESKSSGEKHPIFDYMKDGVKGEPEAEAEPETEVKPKSKAKAKPAVKDVTKNKTVTEVNLDVEDDDDDDDLYGEVEVITRQDLQSLFIKTVERDRQLKGKIKAILSDNGAATLPALDESKYLEVAHAVRAL
jgi:hypothetical protein